MDSPSSRARRQTWIQSSRDSWHTQKDLDPTAQCDPSFTLKSSTARSYESSFSDGCSDGKIESWLRGCGMETESEISIGPNAENMWKISSEDELSLGADAFAITLNHGDSKSLAGLLPPPGNSPNCRTGTRTSRQKPPSLNLGNSTASSCPSFSTISSVSAVLQSCSEDAEETLLQLGFGLDVPQAPARVPIRFFTFPSQLQGINFRLFLQSQLQRIREEDPNLSIASRFRQVEVLTAMANAFYSLYSHVSRTPLPKLTPPEPGLVLSPVEKLERFRGAYGGIRSEPRSPVERLKDTVSKMCLYTGGPRRNSDSASPQASPRKRHSLPEVVGIVLENAKLRAPKRLEFLQPAADVRPHGDKGDAEQHAARTAAPKLENGDAGCQTEVGTGEPSDVVADGNGVTSSDIDESRKLSFVGMCASSSSGEPASQPKGRRVPSGLDRNSGATCLVCDAADKESTREVKVSHDTIFPSIVENSYRHTLLCRSPTDKGDANPLPHVLSGRKTSPVRTCLGPDRTTKTRESSPSRSRGVSMETSDIQEDCRLDNYAGQVGPTLTHQLGPRSSHPPCCITVTGSEEDDVTSLVKEGPNRNLKQALATETRQPLSPLKHLKVKDISNKFQQANSFEMEEVSSAGEEDFGQSESTQITAMKRQCKDAVVRGDSMQSDSSGYAEEDVGS